MNVFKELYQNRKLIWKLSKNDFRNKFAGAYFGIIWAFIQPMDELPINPASWVIHDLFDL